MTCQKAPGHERNDEAMLNPNASAVLPGVGLERKYMIVLACQDYPSDKTDVSRCRHKFHSSGGGESWCHRVIEMPTCASAPWPCPSLTLEG